jgi:hypothetical protein
LILLGAVLVQKGWKLWKFWIKQALPLNSGRIGRHFPPGQAEPFVRLRPGPLNLIKSQLLRQLSWRAKQEDGSYSGDKYQEKLQPACDI